jgi:hypothetical protein
MIARRSDHPTPVHHPRLTDGGVLETLDAVYEYLVWMADAGAIDFDYVADLSHVIRELRLRGSEHAA